MSNQPEHDKKDHESSFWKTFWDRKASEETDFQATGRSRMDIPGFLYTVRESARILKLEPQDKLLDIGCGTGIVALAFSPWIDHVHGVDISEGMVARATQNTADANNITIAQGLITDTGATDACYDKILAYSVLQYLPDMAAVELAFSEIERVLKPGGIALLAANPDPARRHKLVEVIKAKSDLEMRQTELDILDRTGWFTGDDLAHEAARVNMKAVTLPISERIWQHFYMFDLLLTK